MKFDSLYIQSRMMSAKESFFSIVRLGIGHSTGAIPGIINWDDIQGLAIQQGLSAIVLDGIEELRKQPYNVALPEEKVLKQWIEEVLQGYEYRYELYRRAIAEMAGFYNSHGYKMMILKGYACSLDWPKPEHRPTGDIDIWQFGRQKEADALLSQETGKEIDSSHHHHTVFYWRDFMVENHYDFDNVHARKSNAKIEVIFKDLAQDDSHTFELYGEKIYFPSANLHALFLIRHNLTHFVGSNITIRQLLDWAFFAEKHKSEIDWEWLNSVVEVYHMKDFLNCINAICIDELGFDSSIFSEVQFNPELKDRILVDILNAPLVTIEPESFFPRLEYKYRRWKSNAWKQNLCFKETRWSLFWGSVWSHLLKPSSL